MENMQYLVFIGLWAYWTNELDNSQSSRGLDNLWISQLADSKFSKITESIHYIVLYTNPNKQTNTDHIQIP